jgi:error-prone DNA polymerase
MDEPSHAYVPLWCKSNFSFLEGASHPDELVAAASSLGLGALGLTDRHGVYGVVRAHEAARQAGLPLVLGAQVTVDGSTLVLLAQNREGWARLCALVTLGHRGQPKGGFGLTARQVAERGADLVALWCPPGPLAGADDLADAFGDRLYAVVPRHRWTDDPELERQSLALGRRHGVPLVAATEVLYHHPGRQELQDAVTCVRHGVRLADAGTRLKPNAGHGLLSVAEFHELYADHPDWVARTVEVAGRCRFSLPELEYRYPVEGVPDGYTTEGWLKKATDDGAAQRYRGRVPPKVRAQLDKELALIADLQYSGYFLTMWEIVRFCRAQGILCQGRGSAANSAVCFCLGITAVDPVAMELLFERFLSKERAEPPDIDLDIEHHRREEVIQHMYKTYGRHRAAMVANVVRYRGRSALREMGKVLGVPEVDLDRGAKLIHHHEEGLEGSLRDSGFDPALASTQTLQRLATGLEGFPRHLSIHPGGFLLGSEALDRIVPVENATMADRTVVQWDKNDVEAMGLFKVDLLGLGALTHLDYALKLLKDHRGQDLSMADIPTEDPAVYAMLGRGDSVGVFQIESRAQMAMLPRLKPTTYYDLVIEISLVRPGPITGGMVHPYLRRRAGEEPISYPHPSLEPVLARTLGVPLFQEQVMKLAMVAADYTPGEADQLRRDMAAWKSTGRIEAHHERLVNRMVGKGIDREFAERVFAQIRGFGEYGFPESHAASFALIAYATAWFKCHHPDVFACALLNAWPMGFYAPATIVGDARRHHVPLLPVDLTVSDWDCTLEDVGHRFLAVRMGLRYVRGLAKADADRLLGVRNAGGALAAWKARARVAPDTWEKLAVAGALAAFGYHRRDALWAVLDTTVAGPLEVPSTDTTFEAPTAAEALTWDYGSQGLSTQGHLLEKLRPQLRKAGYAAAVEVSSSAAVRPLVYAGLVICRQRPQNAGGVVFLTLEDETGMVNVVVWQKVWDQFRTVVLTAPFLAVSGKIQSEAGVVHLIADRFWVPDGLSPGEAPASHDFY